MHTFGDERLCHSLIPNYILEGIERCLTLHLCLNAPPIISYTSLVTITVFKAQYHLLFCFFLELLLDETKACMLDTILETRTSMAQEYNSLF